MEVYKGNSIGEVLELLEKYNGEAKLIAGGTDIIINMREGKVSPKALIDISGTKELLGVRGSGQYIEIGSAATFTEIAENPLFKGNLFGISKACRSVGSPQIRNRGTIGGNIANGSSAADSVPPLLCLDSTIVLESKKGKREMSLEEYYRDHLTIGGNELLSTIRFNKPGKKQALSFAKLGLRKALAISRISIACLLELDKDNRLKTIKIASGSLGRHPMREYKVEEFLLHKILTSQIIDEGIKALQQSMDERLGGRSTLAYKRLAIEKVFKEAIDNGIEMLKGVKAC